TDLMPPPGRRAADPIPSPRGRGGADVGSCERRQRRVPRAPNQTTLKLGYPSLEPLGRRHQIIEPQQETESRLAITIENRLSPQPGALSADAARTQRASVCADP